MKELYLLRGLPGSGKSTVAEFLGEQHIEADMFFVKDGEYKFDPSKLKAAHNWCHDVVECWMEQGEKRIIVANTFTQDWEMEPYRKLAEDYDYMVLTIIVENRHEGKNIHGVPEEKIQQMRNRFEIKL